MVQQEKKLHDRDRVKNTERVLSKSKRGNSKGGWNRLKEQVQCEWERG